jgi:hypothetical protein
VIRGGLPGNLTALVTPEGAKDRFGDPATPASSWTVRGCWLGPTESRSDEFRATTTVTGWTLYAPAGSSFPMGATVAVAGVIGRVIAPVEAWTDAGVSVSLERVTG